jgi:UDP-glucose-4-epimerase GalE
MGMARAVEIQKVLVTGGAGYLGSFIVRALLEAQWTPIVLDNMSTGHARSVPSGVAVVKGDIRWKGLGERLSEVNPDAVVHLAARSLVSESAVLRRAYYETNALGTASVLRWMDAQGIRVIVYSSSAAVYGDGGSLGARLTEEAPLAPMSAYGETKVAAETLISNWVSTGKGRAVIHRIFNLAGADRDGNIGEDHDPETHLVPLAVRALVGGEGMEPLHLFGGDYATRDGFPLRDYVHPEDAARAVVLSLKTMCRENGDTMKIWNIGSGEGHTSLEVVQRLSQVAGKAVPYERGPRRQGEPAALVADISRVQSELHWSPAYSLERILESAIRWGMAHPTGYAEEPAEEQESPQ